MWLLKWHWRQWLVVRQHFLRKGEEPNLWRQLYTADEGSDHRPDGLAALMRLVPVLKQLAANRVPIKTEDNQEVRQQQECVSSAAFRRCSNANLPLSCCFVNVVCCNVEMVCHLPCINRIWALLQLQLRRKSSIERLCMVEAGAAVKLT